jgi:hypothetical protein
VYVGRLKEEQNLRSCDPDLVPEVSESPQVGALLCSSRFVVNKLCFVVNS